MVKLRFEKGSFIVTIPGQIVKEKKWPQGTELIWKFNSNGNLELSKVEA